jgi:2-oxo-4-hydroxy-4-carboxy-5-ureidoimidazoline decarboxylase
VSADNFVSRYGAIYEHSAWVAERVNELLGDSVADTESLARLMADCVDNASVDAQLELIRAHPDLAGKAQVAGALTADSSEEQAKAGLDQCSPAEFEKFQALNANYIEKFGFPFIMAVRESNRSDILEAFARRLDNNNSAEFETALQEIHKIARLRLDAMEKST